ncbi:MAG: cbb3-type cytochrome c oxidase subunit II [Verrucomicrobiota bacterium]
MNRLRPLFITIALLFFAGWLGFVAYSYLQLGRLSPQVESDGNLPPVQSGSAIRGAKVYAVEGCMTCHSQQVRQPSVTRSDIDRNWGKRPSVARDYLRDQVAFLGTSRIGPDLSNVGVRFTDPFWYYRHLYEPTTVVPGSNMPAYCYLFKLQKIEGQLSEEAVSLTGPHAPKEGYEVVPTEKAKDLVAYLLSRKQDYTLPEVPPVPEK